MQIIHTTYPVNLYVLVTLQDFKHINNMGYFEANLTQLDFNRDIVNK